MWSGWDSIDAQRLKALSAQQFEHLIRALVDAESLERWRARDVVIEGPAAEYVADGNRDVFFRADREPAEPEDSFRKRYTLPFSILGDPPPKQPFAISCKTGKSSVTKAVGNVTSGGETVREILRNGGSLLLATTETLRTPAAGTFVTSPGKKASTKGAGKSAKKGAAKKAAKKTAKKKTAPDATRIAREVLRDDLARKYAEVLAPDGPSAAELASRIRVVDAPELARYLAQFRPLGLRDDLLAALRVERNTNWRTLDAWATREQKTRTWLDFVPDAHREAWIRELVAFVRGDPPAAADRSAVIFGPPGVGKTRLTIEAIRESGFASRVCASINVTRVASDVGAILRGAPSGIIVVDDCPPAHVAEIVEQFESAQADGGAREARARLVVIVPGPRASSPSGDGFGSIIEVEPMDEASTRRMIARLPGQPLSEDAVQSIYEVTEGFPWFVILVAREVKLNAQVPDNPTDAARLAIASVHETRNDRHIVARRARALLAIMLAESPLRDSLDDEARDALARAVDLRDRQELRELLTECADRGVLRTDPRFYVTPEILEREVWRILNPSTSPDPHFLGRLRKHAGARLEKLFKRLQSLRLPADELQAMARAFAADLAINVRSLADAGQPGIGAITVFCARHAPHAIAPTLSSWISSSTGEQLRANREQRRWLVAALRVIARAGGEFTRIEDGLFHLRLAENQAYANNASAVWAWLFVPWIDYAPEPFAARFAILQRRCRTGPTEERVSATSGLGVLVSGNATVITGGGEEQPPSVNSAEIAGRFRQVWLLLLELTADPDGDVADTAQRNFVEHIRRGVDSGLLSELEDAVVAAASRVAEPHRVALRREIEFESGLARRKDVPAATIWERLAIQTEPHTFAQRLRDRLGLHMSTEFVDDGASVLLDENVVREGLTPPERPLLGHVGDFADRTAQRAGSVMITVGRLDEDAAMLPEILAHVRTSHDAYLLSTYCVGQWQAARRERIRGWIDAWREDPDLATAVVETIGRIGPDDVWLRIAADLIASGSVGPAGLRMLEAGRWENVSAPARREFLRVVVDRAGYDGVRLALGRLYRRREAPDPSDLEFASTILNAAAEHVLHGGEAWSFHQLGLAVLHAGLAAPVCRAVVRAASHEDLPGDNVWTLMEACARTAPETLWDALSTVLARPEPAGGRLAIRMAWHDIAPYLPAAPILGWVGTDLHRGLVMAHVCRMDTETPSELASGLLERFGPQSPIARELAANFESTRRPVESLAEFYDQQIARAQRWARTGAVTVRQWAASLIPALERARQHEIESDAAERRRVGT